MCDEVKENEILQPFLILIGTDAVDPTSDLIAAAEQRFSSKSRFHQLAMGSDNNTQQSAVLESIRNCAKLGNWLCLNNVHFLSNSIPLILQVKFFFIKLNKWACGLHLLYHVLIKGTEDCIIK